jgi:hypothetical protein
LEITTITKPTIQNEEIMEKIINNYGHSRLKGLLNPIGIAGGSGIGQLLVRM